MLPDLLLPLVTTVVAPPTNFDDWSFHRMMPGERLVLNPVLNFVSRAKNAGCSADNIVKIACDFYKGEMLIEAKKVLWADAAITRVTERPKVTDNVSDMVRAFDLCDEKKI